MWGAPLMLEGRGCHTGPRAEGKAAAIMSERGGGPSAEGAEDGGCRAQRGPRTRTEDLATSPNRQPQLSCFCLAFFIGLHLHVRLVVRARRAHYGEHDVTHIIMWTTRRMVIRSHADGLLSYICPCHTHAHRHTRPLVVLGEEDPIMHSLAVGHLLRLPLICERLDLSLAPAHS